eukprot:4123639-Amphidinium_carterae.1
MLIRYLYLATRIPSRLRFRGLWLRLRFRGPSFHMPPKRRHNFRAFGVPLHRSLMLSGLLYFGSVHPVR